MIGRDCRAPELSPEVPRTPSAYYGGPGQRPTSEWHMKKHYSYQSVHESLQLYGFHIDTIDDEDETGGNGCDAAPIPPFAMAPRDLSMLLSTTLVGAGCAFFVLRWLRRSSKDSACPVCGGRAHITLCNHPHGTISKSFERHSLVVCKACKFCYTAPWPTPDELSAWYGDAYNDKMKRHYGNTPLPDTHFIAKRASQQAAFIREAISDSGVPAPMRVIAEGGAGWGRLLREFAFDDDAAGRELHMFEYDEDALYYARDVECGGTAAKLNLHAFCDCAPGKELADGSCDLILSSHVLEHLCRPHQVVAGWADLLRPGGLLFVEVPMENPYPLNCNDANTPYFGGHINFFRPKHVLTILENHGLDVLRIQTRAHPVNAVLVEAPNVLDTDLYTGEDRLIIVIARKPAMKRA